LWQAAYSQEGQTIGLRNIFVNVSQHTGQAIADASNPLEICASISDKR
jgi:hypothetical protein